MQSFLGSQPLDKLETSSGDTLPSGENRAQSLFYPPEFELHVPHRRTLCELYNESTLKLKGTDYLVIAYAELNDPRQEVPLAEVLSRFSAPDVNRFISWGNRRFECDGSWFDSPYCDLFFRSWTKAVELFNSLLRYERSICLEEMQRKLQRLSRAFDVALNGLLGCGFTWHVDLMQPISKEPLHSWKVACCGRNNLPLFTSSGFTYNAGAVYALMSMLVLEVRFQDMEKRVLELLDLDAKDERKKTLGPEIEQMQVAIRNASSTALVLHPFNPIRYYATAFDYFVEYRYGLKEKSLLWIQGFLALSKTAIALDVGSHDITQMTKSMIQILTCVLSDRTALDFVYKTAQVRQPVPMVRREKPRLPGVTSACRDREDFEDDELPSATTINAMRATCLRTLGYNVDWSKIELEPLPEDWVPSHLVELDECNADDPSGESAQRCSLARTVLRYFCLYH